MVGSIWTPSRGLPSTAATWATVALVALSATACPTNCSGSDAQEQSQAPWPLDSKLRSYVSPDVQGVAFLRRLGDGREVARFLLRSFAEVTNGEGTGDPGADASSHKASSSPFDLGLFDLERFGFAPDASAVLFVRDGHLGAVAPLRDRSSLVGMLELLTSNERIAMRRIDGGALRQIELASAGETALQFRIERGLLFVRTAPRDPPRDPADQTSPHERFDAFFGGHPPRDTSWPGEGRTRSLVAGLGSEKARLVGMVEPGSWLTRWASGGQGRTILSRMANQIGPTAFRLAYEPESRTASVDLRVRSSPGEPVVVDRLGRAEGSLPPLGGLVEPGILGLLHLSVDPKAVYRLLESTLPAARREQLDVFWRHARHNLQLGGPEAILENLTGRAVFVFYGLESERLSGSPSEILRNIFELEATREVILLPIKSRKKVERLLDKLTQMSKGRLSRQRSDDTVEYAWFDEGELQWALILQDEHVLFVDSATSNAKAEQYERRGRELSRSRLQQMHLAPLLADGDRSGFFVDSGTLANLLEENGYRSAARWLSPFRTMVVTTGMDGDVGRTQIELRLDAP